MSLFRGAIYLAFKLDILERFLEGEVSGGLLYDANIIFGGFEVCVCVWAGAELFSIVELSVAWNLISVV